MTQLSKAPSNRSRVRVKAAPHTDVFPTSAQYIGKEGFYINPYEESGVVASHVVQFDDGVVISVAAFELEVLSEEEVVLSALKKGCSIRYVFLDGLVAVYEKDGSPSKTTRCSIHTFLALREQKKIYQTAGRATVYGGNYVYDEYKITPSLKDLMGTYIGLAPTDESALVLGEIEITIDEKTVKIRMATGLTVQEEEVAADQLEAMTHEEAISLYEDGAPENHVARTVGFKPKGGVNGVGFFFTLDPAEGEFGLIVRGGLADLLGPTVLFAPSHVAAGLHEKAFAEMEKAAGMIGALPRLSNAGKAPKES